MLEGEQLSRAPEAGLHLVDGEERPVAAAELLRAFEIAVRRQVHALPLNRLDEEDRYVFAAQLALEGVQVAERNLREPRQQRTEALDEVRVAVRRERTERQPVKCVVGRDHTRAPRRGAPELQRCLDGLGSGAGEEHALESRRRALEQLFRQQSGQEGHTELDRAGGVELERLDQRRANPRVVPPDIEHPEAAEQI